MLLRLLLFVVLLSCVTGQPCNCPANSGLASELRGWLGSAGFELTLDTAAPDRLPHHLNNVDLAVIGLPPAANPCNCSAVFAQVLLSRDHPGGLAVEHDATTLEPAGVDFRWWDYGRWDSYESGAWTAPKEGRYFGQVVPGVSTTLPPYMMAHPASCFKLMVATGVLLALNDGRLTLDQAAVVNVTAFADESSPRYVWNGTVDSAVRAMITISDNDATTALLALLHAVDVLRPDWESPDNELASLFRRLGLHLLRLEGTQPGGYWGPPTAVQRNRSSDYDTTGFFHMGALDASKLLWLLCPFASTTPGFSVRSADGQLAPVQVDFVATRWKNYLFSVLKDQAYHEVLSSTAICGRPGRRAGIPSLEPSQWIFPPGNKVVVDGDVMSEDVTPCQQDATALFFHKTGSTYTFGSNAGVVIVGGEEQRQYIVSIIGNLGTRFIDRNLASYGNPCSAISVCYTQNIPHIGLQIHNFLANLPW